MFRLREKVGDHSNRLMIAKMTHEKYLNKNIYLNNYLNKKGLKINWKEFQMRINTTINILILQ